MQLGVGSWVCLDIGLVTSRWERGDADELLWEGRVAMGLEEVQVGCRCCRGVARLNLIQATPGVSWWTGAVLGTGGEVE